MGDSEILEVTKVEFHHWPTCLCDVCHEERQRRSCLQPTTSHLKSISVPAAHTLGFIKRRCPAGSRARELSKSRS